MDVQRFSDVAQCFCSVQNAHTTSINPTKFQSYRLRIKNFLWDYFFLIYCPITLKKCVCVMLTRRVLIPQILNKIGVKIINYFWNYFFLLHLPITLKMCVQNAHMMSNTPTSFQGDRAKIRIASSSVRAIYRLLRSQARMNSGKHFQFRKLWWNRKLRLDQMEFLLNLRPIAPSSV